MTWTGSITGTALVAGVVGAPVRHSLSPVIHNAWLSRCGIDGAYVPLPCSTDGFARLVAGLRGGVVRGVNVTLPFKAEALALADRADEAARAAGAANLLLFDAGGEVEARNTDGIGMLSALAERAPTWNVGAGPVLVLGAGGAARGAAAALWTAGVADLRIANRTLAAAEALADRVQGRAFSWSQLEDALDGATLVINATTRGLGGREPLDFPWPAPPTSQAAALDMVYAPLATTFLSGAARRGWGTVDGLAMLIGQARPSFEAFYGRVSPVDVDVRALCLAALEARA